ncbi:MAG: hypothetical protein A2Z20_06425 [Bdellovibrionales bacterium RBG_16_40_8]|nr:MAG: hypothetical protein A2Z20_06425 [Bdellovibrionales bacterium RBG_16_40_8]
MTENLLDMIDSSSAWRFPAKAKAQIQYQSGQLKRREQLGGDPIFTDSQIKSIKSSFSAKRFSGHDGWLMPDSVADQYRHFHFTTRESD